ncbi:MAG: mechanosensitive ion channel [Planctomycetales bacterium]|nr:mechanosensitive ion channel [Planctomycetales bacterium]
MLSTFLTPLLLLASGAQTLGAQASAPPSAGPALAPASSGYSAASVATAIAPASTMGAEVNASQVNSAAPGQGNSQAPLLLSAQHKLRSGNLSALSPSEWRAVAQAYGVAPPVSATGSDASAMESGRSKLSSLKLGQLTSEECLALVEHYGVNYGMRAMLVLVLMIIAFTVSSWSAALVDNGLRRVKFDETLTKFLAKLVRWGILLMTGLVCLSYFGVETTSFAAVLGAAGLAIGLAFQGTLSNFAAGAMLLIFRPYKVGDVVNVAGYLGKVYEIELFTTAVDTLDNRRIIVPNSSIYGAVIENITYHAKRRAEIAVGVAYDADIDATREALQRALASVPKVAAEPEPAVVLVDLGASSVNWVVRGWAANADFAAVKESLVRAVKIELDRAGIGIPFPQLEVHLPSHAAERLISRAA